LTILAADLSSEEHLKRMCGIVGRRTKTLDLLVNVAGVYWRDGLDRLTSRDLHRMFAVNAFAPVLLARHLRPILRGAKGTIVNVSSEAGGIADVKSARPILAYAASKTALNMFTRKLMFELAPDGISVFAMHPGWMRTPMGRREGNPTQPPERTASDLLRLASRSKSLNGMFLDHDGSSRNW
jgi:NAD(P)-dependent dehydrogenase (short-subunit alcohol dehydrogenase family)